MARMAVMISWTYACPYNSLAVNIKYVPLLICHHTSIKWLKNKRGILLYIIQITFIKLDSQMILSYKNKMGSN